MEDPKDVPPIADGEEPNSPTDANTPPKQTTPGETTADMAPGGRPRPNTPKRDVDLSALLTPVEKTELALFIAKVTDTMQKHIVHVFDSTGIDDNTAPIRSGFWARLPAHLKDLTLSQPQPKRRAEPRHRENIKPTDNDSWAPEAEQAGPRLQELKKEVLLHFKKWQTAVHKRVGDISAKRPNDPQGGPSSYGSARRNNRNRYRGKTPDRPVSPVSCPGIADTGTDNNRSVVFQPDANLLRLYPPTSTSLCSMPGEKKALLLHSLLLLLLSLEHYSAYSRVLLLHVASSLHLPLQLLAQDEVRVAKGLSETTKDICFEELLQKKGEEKSTKKWKIAMASAAGAAILGVTGGLAAPLVAAGIGSVLGSIGLGGTATAGLLGGMAESGLLIGALFGIYGARASGKAMEQYTKDVQDFAFIPLHGSASDDSEIGKVKSENRRFRVVIGISGWLTDVADVTSPWTVVGSQAEVYAVRWELESLLKMGNALETVIKSAAWSMAKKEIIARTSKPRSSSLRTCPQTADKHGPVFASLSQALWPVGLLKINKIIDNPWNVAMVRADKAGHVLADIILSKAHGERGVTLIGYSLGARVIYACLMVLAERRGFGLVENVVMMGTPAPSDPEVWCAMKSVVSGRLVNVFSANDYILGFLYRMSSIHFGVAGLQRIEGIDGIENVDVSAKVSGHLRYQYLMGSILKHIGWEDIDAEKVHENEAALERREKENREREQRRDEVELNIEVKKMEQEVKQKNKQAIVQTRARKSKSKK